MRKILMVAFHYPPLAIGSGVHRTLAFSRYLPDRGYWPVVLSADPRAYARVGDDQVDRIPTRATVERAFALDAKKHLAFRGRYPKWASLPDRWSSWCLGAIPAGLRLIREHDPKVIWSTYPIATAHLIAYVLHRLTDLPWIADFRDSMTEAHYPPDPVRRRAARWVERLAVGRCSRGVFTTPGAARMYAQRYPELPPSRWAVIQNGYDEESFSGLPLDRRVDRPDSPTRPLSLLHSGTLYPSERDPRAFFGALADLKRSGVVAASNVRVTLRASGNEEWHREHLAVHGIADIVSLDSALPYHDALAEMLAVDGLLVFQSAGCNHQIPAKVYEYLRAGRPIFAMTDPAGDTAGLLRSAGVQEIAPLDSRSGIAAGLVEFLDRLRRPEGPTAVPGEIRAHTREARTHELARLLDAVLGSAGGPSVR